MSVDAASVAKLVLKELDDFQIPLEAHPLQLGSLLPPEWFASQLEAMRAALVAPYVARFADGRDPGNAPRDVWIVAEDEDVLLAFDPDPEGDFALVFRTAPRPGLSPVRGDAVGCFMAR
jgi:hypothetical protein